MAIDDSARCGPDAARGGWSGERASLVDEASGAHRHHRRDNRLPRRPLARQRAVLRLRAERPVRHQRRADRARLRVRHGRLAGRPRHVQRPRPANARQAAARHRARPGRRPGEVLQVHPRPQGRGHPVPVRHDHVLPDRRPVRHGDQERAAVADLPPDELERVPHGGRRARHHDDDDDVVGRARAVRPVLRAAHDRVEADGVPADRGDRVLADPGRLHHPAVGRPARRLPHRLDRLRAAEPSRPAPAWTPTRSRSA